jgi:hypothetical protein
VLLAALIECIADGMSNRDADVIDLSLDQEDQSSSGSSS